MRTISTVMFVTIAIAALAAVGLTTMPMTTQTAQAGGQCHENTGSAGCTGQGGGFICNKHFPSCRGVGQP